MKTAIKSAGKANVKRNSKTVKPPNDERREKKPGDITGASKISTDEMAEAFANYGYFFVTSP